MRRHCLNLEGAVRAKADFLDFTKLLGRVVLLFIELVAGLPPGKASLSTRASSGQIRITHHDVLSAVFADGCLQGDVATATASIL